jgi:hypothetical protein
MPYSVPEILALVAPEVVVVEHGEEFGADWPVELHAVMREARYAHSAVSRSLDHLNAIGSPSAAGSGVPVIEPFGYEGLNVQAGGRVLVRGN